MKKLPTKCFLSFVLVLAMLIQMLPVQCLANDEKSGESLKTEEAPNVTVLGEMKALRRENVKHFRMSDGSYVAVSYGTPVHYLDENREWKDIDNTMTRDVKTDIYHTNDSRGTTAFSGSLKDGMLFETGNGSVSISMSLLDTAEAISMVSDSTIKRSQEVRSSNQNAPSLANHEEVLFSRNAIARILENPSNMLDPQQNSRGDHSKYMPENLQASILYEDVFPNVDLIYTAYGMNFKEQIVVKEPQNSYRYDFLLKLDGLTATMNKDGSVSLKDKAGVNLYKIPAPYMVDSKGVVSFDVSYALTQTTKGVVLTVEADKIWMNATDRTFPVMIDPTLIFTSGSEQNDIYSAYVSEAVPDDASLDSQILCCGANPGTTNDGRYRIYLHINNLPEIPSNCEVTHANLSLYKSQYNQQNCTQFPIGLYAVTGTKPASYTNYQDWLNALTWNNQPVFSADNAIDYAFVDAGEEYVLWNMTELVKQWYAENTDNTTVCLAMTNEADMNYGDPYAYAGFNVYGDTNIPVMTVSYRSSTGIEPYYTYDALGGGASGTAYIADATGQLKVAKELVFYASSVNPVSLNLVYNSDNFSGSNSEYCFPEDLGLSMNIGSGWTLDCIQKIETETISDVQYLKFYDGDGTVHYFQADDDGVYHDEDGLGLKIETSASGGYTMSDKSGNTWTFVNHFLTTAMDSDGNAININYTDGRILSVTQKNNGKAAITVATFTYDGNTLESVTDAAGNVFTLTYSGNDLMSIQKDGTIVAQYVYNGHRVTGMTDTESGYAIEYAYTNGRISSYQETVGEETGATVAVTYTGNSQTTYRNYGIDRTAETSDDILTHYFFDHTGRTVNAYTEDSTGNILGASNAVYTENSGTDMKNNRTLRSSSIGVAGQQLLRNTGFESTSSDVTWTFSGMSATVAKPRTGYGSVKSAESSTGIRYAYRATESLTAGTVYTLSAYINTAEAEFSNSNGVYLYAMDNNGTRWTSNPLNYATYQVVDGGWIRVSLTFTPEITGTHYVGIYSQNMGGTYYADDFQLEKGETPSNYNLVENGSIQMSGYGWTMGTDASMVTTEGVAGSAGAIKIIGDPENASANAYQDINVNLTGQTYVLSGWVKANAVADDTGAENGEDVSKQCGLRAILYYADGTAESHYVAFNSDLSNVWQFTSASIVPKKADTKVLLIRVMCAYEGNANIAYFDNISLVREAVQTMTYDDDGNLISVDTTGLDNDVVDYVDGTNLIAMVTGGTGTYTYDYDDENGNDYRLKSVTNNLITQYMGYDGTGNVTSTTLSAYNAEGTVTGKRLTASAAYDESGNRLTSVTDSTGASVAYSYDTADSRMTGQPTTVTDPNGTVVTNTYDDDHRISTTSIENQAALQYTYTKGNLSAVNRQNGESNAQTYNLAYDSFGNMLSMKVGSKTLASYVYGAKNGLLTRQTYGNGDTVSFTYDDLGRVKTATYDDGRVLTYTYNGNGQLHSLAETGGTVDITTYYFYDDLGRLIGSEQKSGDTVLLQTGQGYNAYNQMTAQAWRFADTAYSEQYTYNEQDGSLASMTTALGNTLSLSYDTLRRLSSVSVGALTRQYLYRDISDTQTTTQVSTVRYPIAGTSLNYDFNYTYDALGNVSSYALPDGTTVRFTYDDQGQLLGVTGANTSFAYTYDNVGNILSANENGETHSYTYGDSNWKDLLTAYDGQTITYDGSGNPTSYYNGTRWTMGWSNGRTLTSTTDGTTNVSYAYDLGGMRTGKTVGTVTSIYFYASGKLLREIRYNSADQTTAVLDFFYSYDGSPYAMKYNGTVYYFLTNLQGDVVMILNADGSLAGGYVYDPYGKVLSVTGTIAAINPLRYRGYYHDTETGFYYLQSRYYDPEIGRFINADDYASTGQGIIGCNMFTYCSNNPARYYDSEGSRPMDAMNPSEETKEQRQRSFDHMNKLSKEKRYYEEKKTLNSGWLSYYKGVAVIRLPFGGTSAFSFGAIFLGDKVEATDQDANLLRHEYGHTLQLKALGVKNYAALVVIPSMVNYYSSGGVDEDYYSHPVEYTADKLGNVNRTQKYTPDAKEKSKEYWSFAALVGLNLG